MILDHAQDRRDAIQVRYDSGLRQEDREQVATETAIGRGAEIQTATKAAV
jgi:hypothetical protein